uniref:BTB domain-containing protein n=1 Tax=Panagrellus redivivus TaxID=6233 RepID=A0A7E4UUK8_PANRE
MATGIDCLVKQIGDLYLNEEQSDVTIVVQGFSFPAHRLILTQRCTYFKTMLNSGLVESTSNRIEIHEISADGFLVFLEWVYTGLLRFTSIDETLEVIRLAHMYQITEVIDLAANLLKKNFTPENVCNILNEAILLSHAELTRCAVSFVKVRGSEILNLDSFKRLSKDALIMVLENGVSEVFYIDVVCAVVGWMKANPNNSAEFHNISKHLKLSSIELGELEAVPVETFDVIVDLLRQRITKQSVLL